MKTYIYTINIQCFNELILDDVLTIITQVGEYFAVKSIRHVEIYKAEKLLVNLLCV
ncbi:hypothetical protein SAMN05428642_102194 [Flaviramulus basaltis]|uniref:Uncharacterized protein n=1 Tax=Flaviramulus basaltis TaxID=369401 RepID=A0A1K2IHE6_9FLAO|nr:hypothetical protein SAMN05428642_102194 [Flaviramulus basaltis]